MQKSYFLRSTGERIRFLAQEGSKYIRFVLPPQQPWHKERIQTVREDQIIVKESNF